MASINDQFKQAVASFSARLTKEEITNFQFTSMDDVLLAVENIQTVQGRHEDMMNLTRIRRFLEAMGQYGQVIEVFLNASQMLCFVWGPMKFCLQVANTFAESFDTLLDAYEQLGENIPLFIQYKQLFHSDSRMNSILVLIYEDILEFHQAALRVFQKSMWSHLFRSTWKDFQTRFRHILDNLNRHKGLIESQANLSQIREAQAERAESQLHFSMAKQKYSEERYLEVLNWLSAPDTVLDQEAAATIRKEHPSTGLWLLQERQIKAWIDPNSSLVPILWMNGKPGAGKTVLTSAIVEEASKMSDVSTVYFYCNYQDDQRNSFLGMVRALLVQLLAQNDSLLPFLHDQLIDSRQVVLVSAQLCANILETCLKTMPKTYIIVDGVDECELAERSAILSFFTSRIEGDDIPGRLRALFVSQDENDIRRSLRTASVLRLTEAHNKDDIDQYATEWVAKIEHRFGLQEATANYIKTAVCGGSEGMFLFAKLVLTNLFAQLTPENLYRELQPETFPKGFEQAYSRIVVRVYENPDVGHREIAKKLLGWIACSKRPLKLHEIQGALSIDTEEQTVLDARRLYTDVREICGSLVEVLPDESVQLVHGTAKSAKLLETCLVSGRQQRVEIHSCQNVQKKMLRVLVVLFTFNPPAYLIHNDYVQVHEEEHRLAILCLQYLLFDCFADNDQSEEAIKSFIMQGYFAFEDYAILHWVDHLECSIPYLPTRPTVTSDSSSSVINDFHNAYGSSKLGKDDIPKELKERCAHLEPSEYSNSLLLLLVFARKLRAEQETIAGLGDLGQALVKNRAALESLQPVGALDAGTRSKLEQYYGKNWHKCPRHACPYFYRGFPNASSRNSHVKRHEKPFLCTEASCTRFYLGFSTEKELKKHMSINHPDPAVLFPKFKKQPVKHVCNICSKEFTRAHNLKTHKRTHDDDRPFKCSFCWRAFVRKHNCERHVDKFHPEKNKQARQEDTQDTLVAGGEDAENAISAGSSTPTEEYPFNGGMNIQ